MNLIEKKHKHRTLLYERDEEGDRQHVGTIVEQQAPSSENKGLYQWIVPSTSGHVSSYAAAYKAIVTELER